MVDGRGVVLLMGEGELGLSCSLVVVTEIVSIPFFTLLSALPSLPKG